jgi:hypothetical protein
MHLLDGLVLEEGHRAVMPLEGSFVP